MPHHNPMAPLVLAAILAVPGAAVAQVQDTVRPSTADSAAADTAAADTVPTGNFRHIPRMDPDGSDRSMVLSSSADGGAALGWQCTGTGMRVFLALDRHYVGNEDNDVWIRWRFPTLPGAGQGMAANGERADAAGQGPWRLASTGTVAWMRISDIVAFTRAALSTDTVRVTLTDPFDNEDRSAAFGVAGLEAALGQLGCEMRRESARAPGY